MGLIGGFGGQVPEQPVAWILDAGQRRQPRRDQPLQLDVARRQGGKQGARRGAHDVVGCEWVPARLARDGREPPCQPGTAQHAARTQDQTYPGLGTRDGGHGLSDINTIRKPPRLLWD